MNLKHFESLYPETSREEEIDKVVQYLKEGNSSQIIGLSGVGRTTFLSLLAYNRGVRLKHFPKNHEVVHFVMVNFSEIRGRSLSEVMKYLFLCIHNSLQSREALLEEYEVVDGFFKESLSYQDEMVLTQNLKKVIEYLCLEKKLTLIFLFDRFEEYIPSVSAQFFNNLRIFRDLAKYRFSIVFSLNRPLEDILEPVVYGDFSDHLGGNHIYLRIFDEPSLSFRLNYLEKQRGKTLEGSLREKIIEITGGHLRLSLLAFEAFSDQLQMSSQIIPSLLDIKNIRKALEDIWQSLSPAERAYLKGKNKEKSDYLEKSGLLKDGKNTIPLFAKYLEEKKEDGEEKEEEIIFDERKNVILRGEVILSDTLTRSEFFLLRYLLLQQGEIVEREDLIKAVWSDTISTAGVSEQALDQLIFRLRRKIENDPNNPLHLQTIKGRGFKFNP